MAIYNVFHHPLIGYRAVRQHFSWPAFFGTGAWALCHKAYVVGSIALFIQIVLLHLCVAGLIYSWSPGHPEAVGVFLMQFLVVCLFFSMPFGIVGARAAVHCYRRRGFLWVANVEARSASAAIEAATRVTSASVDEGESTAA